MWSFLINSVNLLLFKNISRAYLGRKSLVPACRNTSEVARNNKHKSGWRMGARQAFVEIITWYRLVNRELLGRAVCDQAISSYIIQPHGGGDPAEYGEEQTSGCSYNENYGLLLRFRRSNRSDGWRFAARFCLQRIILQHCYEENWGFHSARNVWFA